LRRFFSRAEGGSRDFHVTGVQTCALPSSAAAGRLVRVVRKLVVDRRRMLENFESTAKSVIAEPLYILLAAAGHPDAHEAVRRLTLEAEKQGTPLTETLRTHGELAPWLERLSPQQVEVLYRPEKYVGIAARKARAVCDAWEARLQALRGGQVG